MSEIEVQTFLLPPKTSNKKTLVLDLDETLVHSQFQPFEVQSDIPLTIELDHEIHDIYILVRPGVKQFLEAMSKIYEIAIFTASVSQYADPLIDIIDKENNCQYRLFRNHCTQINEIFVKELKNLGRDLKDVIILDNSPMSYCLNPENGLPISSWFQDKNDRELFNIIPLLEFLSTVPDVRNYINAFIIDDQISYKNAQNVIKKYNELLLIKNNGKNNKGSKNKRIIKKNNSIKSCQFFSAENKENINNNIIIYKNNNNNKKKNNSTLKNDKIIMRQNSKKNNNNVNEMNYRQKKNNIESNPNIFNNNNIFDIDPPVINHSTRNIFIKSNQIIKNKDLPNINYVNFNSCLETNKPNLTKSYMSLISKLKSNKNNKGNNNNSKIKNNLLISKHKKSESVNGLKPSKKNNENYLINKSNTNYLKNYNNNNMIRNNNKIIRKKNHSLNLGCDNNKNIINNNNNINISKKKGHKYGKQLSLRMNNEINFELDKLNQTELLNNKKISRSLTKEKLKTPKITDTNIISNNCNCCNKSSILNNSKINDVYLYNKIFHKKSKSIVNSFSFISKIKTFKQKIHLSTSESHNNKTLLRNMNMNISKSNNSTINSLTVIRRKNNSQRKMNCLMNKKILQLYLNTNKDKKKDNKIPYNINKKKNTQNEKALKNKIPINKKILIKVNNNNIKNIRYKNDKIEYEITEPEIITLRQNSSKKNIYRKTNRSNNKSIHSNNSFKEVVNDKEDTIQKYSIGNIINNIIYVNNIVKKK